MLCSQARSQPACFSGRTLSCAQLSSKSMHSLGLSVKRALTILAAAERGSVQDEAEALRTSAAELRARLANFDSRSFSGQQGKQSTSDDGVRTAAVHSLAAPLARQINSKEDLIAESQSPARSDAELLLDIEAFERDRGRGAQSSQLEEIFDWSLQIMEAEQVSARQLLQLVCGMSRVIAAADHPQRVAWQAHGAIGAACSAMMECLDSAEDEELVRLATEFGRLGSQRAKPGILAPILDEICCRQEGAMELSVPTKLQFLEMVSALPFLQPAASAARPMLASLDLNQASSKDLHVILRALMATRNQKQLESEFRQALLLSFTQLDKLSPGHLCSLVIAAGQCKQNMPYRKLQRLAELLAAKDPDLESAPELSELLEGCSALGLQHQGLLEAIASALCARMEAESGAAVLATTHAMANMRAQLGEESRDCLTAALKQKFSSASLEVSSTNSGSLPMLIRAMRTLGLDPPRGWVGSASQELVDRIVNLLTEDQDPDLVEGWAVTEAASCLLCLGYMLPPVSETGRLFPAIMGVLPGASPSNTSVLARAVCRLATVWDIPAELWEAIDRAAASHADLFSDAQFCQVLHSFAKWRVTPHRLVPLAREQIMVRCGRLDLHKASMLLWSLAMLSCQEPQAAQALSVQASTLLDLQAYQQGQSHTVDVCNIAWAITTLSRQPMSLGAPISKLMQHARPIQTMTGISMAIMLWACSQSGATPYMLPLYVARIEEVVQDLEPLQITTILYSLGRLNHHPGIELMEALLSGIHLNIQAFAPQGVGQALWACGRLRHHPGVLAGSVLLDLRRRGAEYALEDWTVIVWALTSVGHNTREYLQLAHHMIEEARLETDLKLLSTIIWSAAVFELFGEPVYKRLTQLLHRHRHASHDVESVRRVQEAHLLSCLTGFSRPTALHESFRMPGGVQQWMAELMGQDSGRRTRQQNVRIRDALMRLNIPAIYNFQLVSKEATLHGRELRESIVLRRPYGTSRMVAVELLSPNMLTVNTHQPLWRVLYRAACLCALGFDVMWLPYSEWEAASARRLEEEYLLSRLSALLSGSDAVDEEEIPIAPRVPPLRQKFLV